MSKRSNEYRQPPARLTGRSKSQGKYINLIYEFPVVIAEGDAGTGKTFPPSVIAMDMLGDPRYNVQTIQLVRPNQPLGKSLGYLKGDLYEKMKPWMIPFMDGFEYRKDKNYIRNLVNMETIVPVPTEFLRGRTWNDCFVIVDEAQNLLYDEMKCILRRIGNGCRIVFCADLDQCDLKNPDDSGMHLLYQIDDLARESQTRVPHSWITLEGSVRSDICQFYGDMIKAVESNEK